MKLEHLDHAVDVRRKRERVAELKAAASCGILDPEIAYNGDRFRVAKEISIEPIRAAIIRECDVMLAAYDSELMQMGIEL